MNCNTENLHCKSIDRTASIASFLTFSLRVLRMFRRPKSTMPFKYYLAKTTPNPVQISANEDKPRLSNETTIIKPYPFSYIANLRNLLLLFVPIETAIFLYEHFNNPASKSGVFKKFSEELKENLEVTGCSSDFIVEFIPEYITTILREKLNTGELLDFYDKIEHDLYYAYDNSQHQAIQNQYKIRALQKMLFELGPHGLKYVQTMRPKNPNSWLHEPILSVQSNLPTLSKEKITAMLKEGFKERESKDFIDHFPDHVEVVSNLGAGTIGVTALIKYKETKESAPQEIVAKVIRPEIVTALKTDNARVNRAVDILVAQKRVSIEEANAFKHFCKIKLDEQLIETNIMGEIANYSAVSYQSEHIKTVKIITKLIAKANNILFMEKAEGIELGKHLKRLRQIISNPDLSEREKEAYLADIAVIRKLYSEFAKIHIKKIANNEAAHLDPHPGNLFYESKSKKMNVLDLGAIAHPVTSKAHNQMRQFLLCLYLSAGTADAQYLRFYYINAKKNLEDPVRKIEDAKIEALLKKIQRKLNVIKQDSSDKNVIDCEKAMSEIIGIISTATLLTGFGILPSAMITRGRSERLIAEELNALNQDLAGSKYASEIPYFERTSMAIAIKALSDIERSSLIVTIVKSLWKQYFSQNKDVWTPEMWNYFRENAVTLKELKFKKKFIYGIFGLSEAEADRFDLTLPGSFISAAAICYLGKKVLPIISAKVTDIKDSYKIMQTCKNIFASAPKDVLAKFKSIFPKNHFLEFKKVFQPKTVLSPTAFGTPARHSIFSNSALRKFVPGTLIAAGLMYGAHEWRKRHNSKSS